jgi:hypothetical protein
MASNKSTTERLLDPNIFGTPATLSQVVEGSLAPVGSGGSPASQSQQLTQQLQQLVTLAQVETETAVANAQGTNQVAAASPQGSPGGSIASEAGSAIDSILGLGLGPLSPAITGILGLFGGGGGGGGASVPSPFLMPPPVNVNAGINEAAPTQPFAVDYAAGGTPRGAPSSSSSSGGSGQGTLGQIIVQIQAMDSQSFLDHSDDIAQAVRQAMLQSSVLNDVIREV